MWKILSKSLLVINGQESSFSIEGVPNIQLEYSMAGVMVGAFQSTSHFRFITERDCDSNSWEGPSFDTEGDW